jgi:hypothetical protein
MKNILYLIKSSGKIYKQERVICGTTNYLYRQLLIHNHRWNPSERERQRLRETERKALWKPLIVVTGFPTERNASQFKVALDTLEFNEMGNPMMFKYSDGKRISQVDYKIEQVYWALKEFLPKMIENNEICKNEMKFEPIKLYCESMEKLREVEKKHGPLPFVIKSIPGPIDVGEIDKRWYDYDDIDDDRNYERLRKERLIAEKENKLLGLSNELKIPLNEVEKILDKSRREMASVLVSRKGKSGSKAKAKITLN